MKSGIAWDITDELRKMGIDVQSDCWNVVVPSAVYKGRVYGFPTNAGHFVIWFNKSIFDDNHMRYPSGPWKWKDFLVMVNGVPAQSLCSRMERVRWHLADDTGFA